MFVKVGKVSNAKMVTLSIAGQPVSVPDGSTVAAALLRSDIRSCRITHGQHSPRGPYCMMGVCFDCLVTIDGQAGQQACMIKVQEGMHIVLNNGGTAE